MQELVTKYCITEPSVKVVYIEHPITAPILWFYKEIIMAKRKKSISDGEREAFFNLYTPLQISYRHETLVCTLSSPKGFCFSLA